MDKVLAKSDFLEKVSKLDRQGLYAILKESTKPVKKLRVMSLIKNVGPQDIEEEKK